MKIYQIHKSGGEWEDRYDIIVGSYLKLSEAIKEKNRLREEEMLRIQQVNKCDDYPLFHEESLTDKMIEKINEHCTEYCPTTEEYCANYDGDYDESFFDVREVEVIE